MNVREKSVSLKNSMTLLGKSYKQEGQTVIFKLLPMKAIGKENDKYYSQILLYLYFNYISIQLLFLRDSN